jgi:hypothetical protein
MANLLSAIERWEPMIGGTLEAVSPMGPRDAGEYMDANAEHLARVFAANFEAKGMTSDALSPVLQMCFKVLWQQLPQRVSTFEEQAKVLRILYTVASHARFTRHVLGLAKVTDTSCMGMKQISFRDRNIHDVGMKDRHGPVLHTATNVAMSYLGVPYPQMDMEKYMRELRKLSMRVAVDDATKAKDVAGFVGWQTIDYTSTQKRIVETEDFAGRQATISKAGMGVCEMQIAAMGWDEEMGRSMPIAIIDETLTMYNDRATNLLETQKLAEFVPRKKP